MPNRILQSIQLFFTICQLLGGSSKFCLGVFLRLIVFFLILLKRCFRSSQLLLTGSKLPFCLLQLLCFLVNLCFGSRQFFPGSRKLVFCLLLQLIAGFSAVQLLLFFLYVIFRVCNLLLSLLQLRLGCSRLLLVTLLGLLKGLLVLLQSLFGCFQLCRLLLICFNHFSKRSRFLRCTLSGCFQLRKRLPSLLHLSGRLFQLPAGRFQLGLCRGKFLALLIQFRFGICQFLFLRI